MLKMLMKFLKDAKLLLCLSQVDKWTPEFDNLR